MSSSSHVPTDPVAALEQRIVDLRQELAQASLQTLQALAADKLQALRGILELDFGAGV